MSELADSLLPEENTLAAPLSLKASSVDENRSIRQVEALWHLPQLPDEVRLDLAANPTIGSAPST